MHAFVEAREHEHKQQAQCAKNLNRCVSHFCLMYNIFLKRDGSMYENGRFILSYTDSTKSMCSSMLPHDLFIRCSCLSIRTRTHSICSSRASSASRRSSISVVCVFYLNVRLYSMSRKRTRPSLLTYHRQ